jgi:hypothetical protein
MKMTTNWSRKNFLFYKIWKKNFKIHWILIYILKAKTCKKYYKYTSKLTMIGDDSTKNFKKIVNEEFLPWKFISVFFKRLKNIWRKWFFSNFLFTAAWQRISKYLFVTVTVAILRMSLEKSKNSFSFFFFSSFYGEAKLIIPVSCSPEFSPGLYSSMLSVAVCPLLFSLF